MSAIAAESSSVRLERDLLRERVASQDERIRQLELLLRDLELRADGAW